MSFLLRFTSISLFWQWSSSGQACVKCWKLSSQKKPLMNSKCQVLFILPSTRKSWVEPPLVKQHWISMAGLLDNRLVCSSLPDWLFGPSILWMQRALQKPTMLKLQKPCWSNYFGGSFDMTYPSHNNSSFIFCMKGGIFWIVLWTVGLLWEHLPKIDVSPRAKRPRSPPLLSHEVCRARHVVSQYPLWMLCCASQESSFDIARTLSSCENGLFWIWYSASMIIYEIPVQCMWWDVLFTSITLPITSSQILTASCVFGHFGCCTQKQEDKSKKIACSWR